MADPIYEKKLYTRLLDAWFVLNDLGQSDRVTTHEGIRLRDARAIVHRHMDILVKAEKADDKGESK